MRHRIRCHAPRGCVNHPSLDNGDRTSDRPVQAMVVCSERSKPRPQVSNHCKLLSRRPYRKNVLVPQWHLRHNGLNRLSSRWSETRSRFARSIKRKCLIFSDSTRVDKDNVAWVDSVNLHNVLPCPIKDVVPILGLLSVN
jgi:hypothetical protein